MKLTITGDAYALTSTIKVDEIELLKKYNPDALSVKDKDGNVKFKVSYSEGKGSITPYGVTFGGKGRGESDGCATVTGTLPAGLSTDEAKKYVVELVGGVVAYLEQLEKDVTKAAEAVSTQRKKLIDGITVA